MPRYYLFVAVDISAKLKGFCLVEVAYYREAPTEVSVERAVTDSSLALVAGVQQYVAEFVRYCHDDDAAASCLKVFFCDIKRHVVKDGLQGLFKSIEGILDWHDMIWAA